MEKHKLVYMAGPVRSLGRTAAIQIRSGLEIYFLRRGMVTFNPPGAFCGDMSDGCEATVKECNDSMLRRSNLVAAIYIPGVQSLGTDAEMVMAAYLGIPIVVCCHSRDDISDAIAWVNPLMAEAPRKGNVSVEFAVMSGSKLETVTVIEYKPVMEDAIG